MSSIGYHAVEISQIPMTPENVAELDRARNELEMDIADPSFVSVKIDDVLYEQGKDWRVEGRKIILDPAAPACSKLRDAKIHSLKIRKECKRPIYI